MKFSYYRLKYNVRYGCFSDNNIISESSLIYFTWTCILKTLDPKKRTSAFLDTLINTCVAAAVDGRLF